MSANDGWVEGWNPAIGDVVRLDSQPWSGRVYAVATTGAVRITGWRGWVSRDRLSLLDTAQHD